jgi:excisionase family DNA binding protein
VTGNTLSIKDLTRRYGVSQHTVLGWIRAGELRAVNVGRRPGAKKPRWRITAEALAAFELARTPTPTPPRAPRRKRPADIVSCPRNNQEHFIRGVPPDASHGRRLRPKTS